MIKRQLSRLYIKIINKDHLRIGKNTNVSRKSEFEGSNYIGCNSTFNGRLGYASYIGDECDISAAVGRYTSIAAKVRTINGFHPTGRCRPGTSAGREWFPGRSRGRYSFF